MGQVDGKTGGRATGKAVATAVFGVATLASLTLGGFYVANRADADHLLAMRAALQRGDYGRAIRQAGAIAPGANALIAGQRDALLEEHRAKLLAYADELARLQLHDEARAAYAMIQATRPSGDYVKQKDDAARKQRDEALVVEIRGLEGMLDFQAARTKAAAISDEALAAQMVREAELLGAATALWQQGRLKEALDAAHKAPDVPLRASMIKRFERDLAKAKAKGT